MQSLDVLGSRHWGSIGFRISLLLGLTSGGLGCFWQGKASSARTDGGGEATAESQRIAVARASLQTLSEVAWTFASEYERQVVAASSTATFDGVAALAFLDAAPSRWKAMGDEVVALQRLVEATEHLVIESSHSALSPAGAVCEEESTSGFWSHLRGFVSNLLGGPIPADNLYAAAEEGNRVRDRFKAKWQPRIDACNKIPNRLERDLCLAQVSQESRTDFVQAASELSESCGFVVIKALGAGVVGLAMGAGAAALAVPTLGAVVVGATATVVAEDVIDYFFRPAPVAVKTDAKTAVVIVRSRSSVSGTSVNLPAGDYQVLVTPHSKQGSLSDFKVATSVSHTIPTSCPAKPTLSDAALYDTRSLDSSPRACPRSDLIPHPQSGLCVCAPKFYDYSGRCLPFVCKDIPYDPIRNNCDCGDFSIPSLTEQNGMITMTCAGF